MVAYLFVMLKFYELNSSIHFLNGNAAIKPVAQASS
jgi:hypothetical protein